MHMGNPVLRETLWHRACLRRQAEPRSLWNQTLSEYQVTGATLGDIRATGAAAPVFCMTKLGCAGD